MPVEWQQKMIALLDEAGSILESTPDYHVLREDPAYTLVEPYDSEDESSRDYIFTALCEDPWADYRRGDIEELMK